MSNNETRLWPILESKSRWFWRWGPALAVAFAGLLAAPWLMGPACPRHVVIATGGEDGAYFRFAQQYKEILARDGIELEIRSTAGTVENISLLADDASGVTLALAQGGVATEEDLQNDEINSLASLYQEPVWIFYRGNEPINQLSQLSGKKVALGANGSGTQAIAKTLLKLNRTEVDQTAPYSRLSGGSAADSLLKGEIDAAVLVISPGSPLVKKLMASENVQLFDFRRAEAYCRIEPTLSRVILAEGMLDFEQNRPAADVNLLAPTANLIACSDMHPALVPLLLQAATEVHRSGSVIDAPDQFPSARHVDFTLNSDARRFLDKGPSIAHRYLPFWLAVFLDRSKILLLPLCTLLLPLLKAAPPIYRWRIRSKIYRWYTVLRDIEQRMKDEKVDLDIAKQIERLTQMESELADVTVPLSYMEEFYNLRLHVEHVRKLLERCPQRETTAQAGWHVGEATKRKRKKSKK